MRVGIRERYKIRVSVRQNESLEECTGAAWCHVSVPAGQRVRGLDHRVLLLPSGCVSDDKRGQATDENSDLSCDHGPRMLLKTQSEMENETFDRGQVS